MVFLIPSILPVFDDLWQDAGTRKLRRPIGSSNYLVNYLAATNLPFLTILTKAGLEQSPFLSK